MSGNAGLRGYYFQILAGLLESLTDGSWEMIEIEPNTMDDKVDVKWVYSDRIRAVQVKSSINNFERSKIISWICELVRDARSEYAEFDMPIEYNLYLIGTTERNANKWISDLRGRRLKIEEGSPLKEIENEIYNVEVTQKNFDLEELQAISFKRMHQYLERSGKSASSQDIEALCSVIVDELMKITVQRKHLTKSMFENLVNKFLDSGEYGISTLKQISELSLSFYEKGKVPESITMNGIVFDKKGFYQSYLNKAKLSLFKFKELKIPQVTENQSKLFSLNSNLSIPVEVDLEEVNHIKDLALKFLDVNLEEEDFYFGNLRKSLVQYNPLLVGSNSDILEGTEDEKTKYTTMEKAYYYLMCCKVMSDFFNDYLSTCYPLPLILKNTGVIADEDIKVTLKFPASAHVITSRNMRVPHELLIEDFINDDSVFNNLIVPARDSEINQYEGDNIRIAPIKMNSFFKASYTAEDFIDHLDYLFEFKYYNEEEQDIVQYEFKKLNPSCKMAFPTYLMVQTEENMNIKYAITSKNGQRIEGTLHWVHPKT